MWRCRNRRVRSVVEAVQCAGEIQQEMSEQEPDPPQAAQMRFRIGIDQGDVMVAGSDIFGDGVISRRCCKNSSKPGGVVVSASVYIRCTTNYHVALTARPAKEEEVVPVISYRVAMGGVGRHSYALDKGPTPQAGAGSSLESWRSTNSRPIRAIHVDEFHRGSVSEPASPHCSDPHSFGLSDS